MRREIKFRAWNKYDKKMISPHEGDFIRWHAMSNWKDCLEVMQYTGLEDKNGKEIYEGDIVKYNKLEAEILFRYGGYGFYTGGTFHDLYGWHEALKIIGSIHENPELLNNS